MTNNKPYSPLKAGSLLQQGKLRVIDVISYTDNSIVYNVRHTLMNTSFQVHELFVRGVQERQVDRKFIVTDVEDEEQINDWRDNFLDIIRKGFNDGTITDAFEENGTIYYVNGKVNGTGNVNGNKASRIVSTTVEKEEANAKPEEAGVEQVVDNIEPEDANDKPEEANVEPDETHVKPEMANVEPVVAQVEKVVEAEPEKSSPSKAFWITIIACLIGALLIWTIKSCYQSSAEASSSDSTAIIDSDSTQQAEKTDSTTTATQETAQPTEQQQQAPTSMPSYEQKSEKQDSKSEKTDEPSAESSNTNQQATEDHDQAKVPSGSPARDNTTTPKESTPNTAPIGSETTKPEVTPIE
ncbi:MAG: hypothetical protein J6Z41_04075 [Prevotella sp.]|nr:hypothetical protein [Prevotella sp.]